MALLTTLATPGGTYTGHLGDGRDNQYKRTLAEFRRLGAIKAIYADEAELIREVIVPAQHAAGQTGRKDFDQKTKETVNIFRESMLFVEV